MNTFKIINAELTATKVSTNAIKDIPNNEYVNITLHSQKQCEEAQANGFEILCRDYAGHLIPYIRVKWSDIMKINQ